MEDENANENKNAKSYGSILPAVQPKSNLRAQDLVIDTMELAWT